MSPSQVDKQLHLKPIDNLTTLSITSVGTRLVCTYVVQNTWQAKQWLVIKEGE